MHGTVRVTSKRKGGTTPEPGEIVIHCDRSNPVLGNPHILADHRNNEERARVVEAFRLDLEADFAVKGPKFLACVRIAELVTLGERIALSCWCAMPNRSILCHANHIRDKVLELAGVTKDDFRLE